MSGKTVENAFASLFENVSSSSLDLYASFEIIASRGNYTWCGNNEDYGFFLSENPDTMYPDKDMILQINIRISEDLFNRIKLY
jgi:hypothetical protein